MASRNSVKGVVGVWRAKTGNGVPSVWPVELYKLRLCRKPTRLNSETLCSANLHSRRHSH